MEKRKQIKTLILVLVCLAVIGWSVWTIFSAEAHTITFSVIGTLPDTPLSDQANNATATIVGNQDNPLLTFCQGLWETLLQLIGIK